MKRTGTSFVLFLAALSAQLLAPGTAAAETPYGDASPSLFVSVATPTPVVTSFTPTFGPPGTSVTIIGSAFTGATLTRFNGVGAVFAIDADTQITATVPPSATTGTISVTSTGGTGTSGSVFTVAPIVTMFSPAGDTVGASVIVTGLNFTNTTDVTFNGVSALFVEDFSTQVTAQVPGGATIGPIAVTTAAGTGTSATSFVVAPEITVFSPGSGSPGTEVTVEGVNFDSATAVEFNGTPATFSITSNIKISATVPDDATTGPISVKNAGGTAVSADTFNVAPIVHSFSPGSGVPGTQVTILGLNFTPATDVDFNGTPAGFAVNADTEIVATVPLLATTGPITVTSPAGSGASADPFVIQQPPVVTGFTPAGGGVGVQVTISGTGFTGADSVAFNGTDAAFTTESDTEITATVPSGATSGPVIVGNLAGTFTTLDTFTVTLTGRICISKYFDSNHNQLLDPGEGPMAGVSFTLTGPDTLGATTDSLGQACLEDIPPGSYVLSEIVAPGTVVSFPKSNAETFEVVSGLDTSVVWLNGAERDSTAYRTGSMSDWATAVDGKGKLKAVKCKPDKVDFKFNLVAPAAAAGVTVKLGMLGTGTLYAGKGKITVLTTFTGVKEFTTSASFAQGDTVQVDGRGAKGKPVKASYIWQTSPKVTKGKVLEYKLNVPRLPMPNLHNVGTELQALTGFPLVIGASSGASSVLHAKYKDALASLNKKGMLHTGAAGCLRTFTNTKPIAKQQKKLPPDKSNNRLFAEVLTLGLNIDASDKGRFTAGLGDLIYDNHKDTTDTSSSFFNGKTIRQVYAQANTFLACVPDTQNPKPGSDAGDYAAVVKKINDAFAGPVDTLSWNCGPMVALRGVRVLKSVPYLRAEPGIAPPAIAPANPIPIPLPAEYGLRQNYPNPFNPTTTIAFDLPAESFVTLKVYDILGREVAVVLDGETLDEGDQDAEFDASLLPSGVYFYRLVARPIDDDGAPLGPAVVRVKKMLLVK